MHTTYHAGAWDTERLNKIQEMVEEKYLNEIYKINDRDTVFSKDFCQLRAHHNPSWPDALWPVQCDLHCLFNEL